MAAPLEYDPKHAACHRAGVDPFSDEVDELRQVLRLCRSCPIARACRASWDAAPSAFGVWGGRLGIHLARERIKANA